MDHNTKVNSITTIYKEKVFIFGLIKDNMMEIGKIIKWMEKDYSHGVMDESNFYYFFIL